MKRVIQIVLLILAACTVSMLAAVPAMAATTPGDASNITLSCHAHWGSYAEYTQRRLTVDYNITNSGAGSAYNTTIETVDGTNGVTANSVTPIWMGDLDGGQSQTVSFRWHVPAGVPQFRSTLQICNDCRPDMCVDGTNGGVDIKPGSCPNPINIGQGNALVAVAVFSHGGFDATTLDDASVLFAGASPTGASEEDKNGDGRPDMLYHFSRNSIGLAMGDSRACLSASIVGGGTFRSCDMVIVR